MDNIVCLIISVWKWYTTSQKLFYNDQLKSFIYIQSEYELEKQ